ncbi:MAG: peptidoglycan DD-metalloendopeptidase family protein [Oscillospiraceae bacterium]
MPTVKIGDTVRMGTVIGAVGDTAVGETGEVAHLHFAVTLDGASVDPAEYLPQ